LPTSYTCIGKRAKPRSGSITRSGSAYKWRKQGSIYPT
jgi:hypothetical protein